MQAAESFERTAAAYDRARQALVNCQDLLYQRAVEAIPQGAKRILELGAGTGLLSAEVAKAFPEADLVLVDAAPAMLEQAMQRLADCRQVQYELLDYREALPEGTYDAVLSSLSIHHLTHEGKRSLFERVYGVLRAGGVFANADQVLGSTPEIEMAYRETWEMQSRQAGASEEDIQASLERQKLDISATLADQLDWLAQAGFKQVDCVFKDYRFAVMTGKRP